MSHPELGKTCREIHWYILQIIHACRPLPAGDALLRSTLRDVWSGTHVQLRNELDYLHERQLVELHEFGAARWSVKLTDHGIAVLNNTAESELVREANDNGIDSIGIGQRCPI